MKQYSLRYLYSNLGRVMKDLPFEITNHNKVIAVVRGGIASHDQTIENPEDVEKLLVKSEKNIKNIKKDPPKEKNNLCEHGIPKKLCKKCMFKK